MSQTDIASADLPDELGCTFEENGRTLPLAKGYAGTRAPARALIPIGDEKLYLSVPEGGFGAIVSGGKLSSESLSIDVRPQGEDQQAGEGTRHDAILSVNHGSKTDTLYDGDWLCGP